MKSDEKVISFFNRYLQIELTGHKQYLLHGAKCKDWGFTRLAEKQLDYAQEETQHAAKIMQRLLFLEGEPALQDARVIEVKDSVPEQLALDKALVQQAIDLLREAVSWCEQQRDAVLDDTPMHKAVRYALNQRKALERFLEDGRLEEHHLHWLEQQHFLIGSVGLENYLQANT